LKREKYTNIKEKIIDNHIKIDNNISN
jgi:hypothetical protein